MALPLKQLTSSPCSPLPPAALPWTDFTLTVADMAVLDALEKGQITGWDPITQARTLHTRIGVVGWGGERRGELDRDGTVNLTPVVCSPAVARSALLLEPRPFRTRRSLGAAARSNTRC